MTSILCSSKFRNTVVFVSLVVIGSLIHGASSSGLGLYRDDAWILMQGLLAADGDPIHFILSDTAGYLLKERPVAHLAWIVARGGFLLGLPFLHLILTTILILNAITLAIITRRIVATEWFAFAVAAVFLSYPLSPLQTIMGATVHYLVGSLLALQAVLFTIYGLESKTTLRRSLWLIAGAISYLASLLTHEVFILIPPVFICIYEVLTQSKLTSAGQPAHGRQLGLSSYLAMIGLYVLWRTMILPFYKADYVGLPDYSTVLDPVTLGSKIAFGLDTILIPWDRVLAQLLLFPPGPGPILVAAVVFAAVWLLTYCLSSVSANTSANGHRQAGRQWLHAAVTGCLLILAGLVVVSVSADNSIKTLNGMPSRVNFASLIGVSVLLPTIPVLLIQYYGTAKAHKTVALSCLVFIVFVHAAFHFNDPSIGRFFARYSLPLASAVATFVIVAVVACTLLIIRSRRSSARARAGYPSPSRQRFLLAGIVASLVFVGSLFHSSIKQEWASAWAHHKSMLNDLHTIAPAFKDDTFVIIAGAPESVAFRLIRLRVVGGQELSVHLLVLYENWSLMGHLTEQPNYNGLFFFSDGIEVRKQEAWFSAGVKGPFVTRATAPIPRVSYDRVVVFEFNGRSIRLLPEVEVRSVTGEPLVVRSNSDRILSLPTIQGTTWQYVTR